MTNIEAARVLDTLLKHISEEDGYIGKITNREMLAIGKAVKALRKLESVLRHRGLIATHT